MLTPEVDSRTCRPVDSDIVLLPEQAVVEELTIMPSAGVL